MFVFLTELFAKSVRGVDDRRLLGRPVDLVANAEEVYPAVVGFMVRRGRRPAFYLPWSQIAAVEQDEILVRGTPEAPGRRPAARGLALRAPARPRPPDHRHRSAPAWCGSTTCTCCAWRTGCA